jgi:UDP-glucose 4-epimerase
MKVLVTGATGRIGANVVDDLRRRGHQVRAFVYPGDASRAHKLDAFRDVELVPGDLRDREAVNRAVAGVEAVVHLGAAMGGPFDNVAYFDINARGTLLLLEAARELAPNLRRFVYASTDSMYVGAGDLSGMPSFVTEEMGRDDHPMPYVLTKFYGEHLCRRYHAQYGLPTVVLRFANQVGPGEWLDARGLPRGEFLLHWHHARYRQMEQKSPDDERSWQALDRLVQEAGDAPRLLLARNLAGQPYQRSYCDVRDTVYGVRLAVEKDEATGEVFTLSGAVVRWDHAVPYMSQQLGVPYVEATLSRRFFWEYDTSKMRLKLGYEWRHGVESMAEAALAVRRGEDIGWILCGERYGPAPAAVAAG